MPAGKSAAIEDFDESMSHDDIAENQTIEHSESMDADSSDTSDEDCAMDTMDDDVRGEIYPIPINSEDVRVHDWLVVKFFYSSKKPSNFTN